VSDDAVGWITQYTEAKKYLEWKIRRLQAANELAQEQLRRSYRQIALSEELLRAPIPEVWLSGVSRRVSPVPTRQSWNNASPKPER